MVRRRAGDSWGPRLNGEGRALSDPHQRLREYAVGTDTLALRRPTRTATEGAVGDAAAQQHSTLECLLAMQQSQPQVAAMPHAQRAEALYVVQKLLALVQQMPL